MVGVYLKSSMWKYFTLVKLGRGLIYWHGIKFFPPMIAIALSAVSHHYHRQPTVSILLDYSTVERVYSDELSR